jgi:hypothetical protein
LDTKFQRTGHLKKRSLQLADFLNIFGNIHYYPVIIALMFLQIFTRRPFRITAFFLLLHLAARAQIKPVVNLSVYFTVRLPGMVPLDENGNPIRVKPDTTLYLYAETTTKLIDWEKLWYDGKLYDVSSQRIISSPFVAGSAKTDHSNIVVTTQKGNYLWQLSVAPSRRVEKTPCAYKNNKILVVGKNSGKTFHKKAGNPVELYIVPSQ